MKHRSMSFISFSQELCVLTMHQDSTSPGEIKMIKTQSLKLFPLWWEIQLGKEAVSVKLEKAYGSTLDATEAHERGSHISLGKIGEAEIQGGAWAPSLFFYSFTQDPTLHPS